MGSIQRIPACPYLCAQGKNVENYRISWHSLFCVPGIHVSSHIYCSGDSFGGAAMKSQMQKYDYHLIILTTFILFAIGMVCVYGITYYNYLAASPRWTGTIQYSQYIDDMNSYLYPFLVLLLISLGLCIPKRLFEQDTLIKFSALVLGMTIILTFLLGLETGLGFILAVMAGVQGLVLILTFKKSKTIRFEKEGYIGKLGSSFLHLGVALLIFNFVTLRESPFHIPIFWFGTILITAGNILSFYPDKISSLFPTP